MASEVRRRSRRPFGFARTLLWSSLLVGRLLTAADIKVLLMSPGGQPIRSGAVEASTVVDGRERTWSSGVDVGEGYGLSLPSGNYRLTTEALGFAAYDGILTVASASEEKTVRIGLTPAVDSTSSSLRGKIVGDASEAVRLWVSVEPLYELAWTSTVDNQAAVPPDGTFLFQRLRDGPHLLLVHAERRRVEGGVSGGTTHDVVWARVIEVDGDTEMLVNIDVR